MDIFFERLSAADLKGDREKLKLLTQLHSIFRGSLSLQRKQIAGRLTQILSTHAKPRDFSGWQRVIDYKYSDHPLSAHGSVVSETGGRFNVGDVDLLNLRSFPALYLGSDRKVAFFEKYGVQERGALGKLAAHEAALADPGSVTCVQVKGHLESCVDIEDRKCLKKLVTLFSTFTIPVEAQKIARRLGSKPLTVIKTPEMLLRSFREENWRQWTMHFDLLSNSQNLGQIAWAAGIEAVAYSSTKAKGHCLAIYPENFKNSSSFVEVVGAHPATLVNKRMDSSTWQNFV